MSDTPDPDNMAVADILDIIAGHYEPERNTYLLILDLNPGPPKVMRATAEQLDALIERLRNFRENPAKA